MQKRRIKNVEKTKTQSLKYCGQRLGILFIVKALACKSKDLSLFLKPHFFKKPSVWHMLVVTVLGKQRRVAPWGSSARHSRKLAKNCLCL